MRKQYKKHQLSSHKGMQNKKMNENTYKERRIVMNHLYTLKNHVRKQGMDIPRINVRICERTKYNSPLGVGRANDTTIWIPIDYFQNTRYEKHLLFVVAHEILHAAYNIKHDDNCPLMCPRLNTKVSNAEVLRIFTKYVKKYGK
jgi:extradiol dioxygenase family protein